MERQSEKRWRDRVKGESEISKIENERMERQ